MAIRPTATRPARSGEVIPPPSYLPPTVGEASGDLAQLLYTRVTALVGGGVEGESRYAAAVLPPAFPAAIGTYARGNGLNFAPDLQVTTPADAIAAGGGAGAAFASMDATQTLLLITGALVLALVALGD